MPTVSSQESSVARLYAAAMLDLAEAQGEADVLLGELFDFAGRVAEDADSILANLIDDVDPILRRAGADIHRDDPHEMDGVVPRFEELECRFENVFLENLGELGGFVLFGFHPFRQLADVGGRVE